MTFSQTAVVHLIHNLSPIILPKFMSLGVPAITTLYFRETEPNSGLLKIYKQEDSLTLEGLIQCMPIMSFWYNHVLRAIAGKILVSTGDIFESALVYAQSITLQSQKIQMLTSGSEIKHSDLDPRHDYILRSKEWKECYIYEEDSNDTYEGEPLQEHIYLDEE
ncbi:hypothetical protein G6F46_012512 [Rhizopus delemar]|uniref:Uncharacterized protein n=2 Tax=Rhizopus TaxID=4842 RepID=A0A9P7CHL7_9FUNG|nr:hypothetical protein G6F55_012334 [Rhizopus delemar]KAG1533395.1 hypothetical protein G6F51_012635 [Rhizopus arrhizus]KAG1487861.1 hypothetical protein G6F54_012403 [Rhizopus delemar]KAG1494567.1 hypothetical protein G6F53_012547 [Rhizopus delemar]KAG1504466.1 hypothetical protein G6F52_012183 [Rhizopus delemar]